MLSVPPVVSSLAQMDLSGSKNNALKIAKKDSFLMDILIWNILNAMRVILVFVEDVINIAKLALEDYLTNAPVVTMECILPHKVSASINALKENMFLKMDYTATVATMLVLNVMEVKLINVKNVMKVIN